MKYKNGSGNIFYAYYKAESPSIFNNETGFYKDYMDCYNQNEDMRITGLELSKILSGLQEYFK